MYSEELEFASSKWILRIEEERHDDFEIRGNNILEHSIWDKPVWVRTIPLLYRVLSIEKIEQITELIRWLIGHKDFIISNHDKLENIRIRISFGRFSSLLIILSINKKYIFCFVIVLLKINPRMLDYIRTVFNHNI